jgi:hypothetical protein
MKTNMDKNKRPINTVREETTRTMIKFTKMTKTTMMKLKKDNLGIITSEKSTMASMEF